jgi:hypothetical protein
MLGKIKIRYFILGTLMLAGLLIRLFAPPICCALDTYTLQDAGTALFALSFFFTFLMLVSEFSEKKDK